MVALQRFLPVTGESLLSSTEVVIELPQEAVSSVALEMTLLIAGLAETLRIQPTRGPSVLFRLLAGDRVSKAVVTRHADGMTAFSLGRNQAKYFQATLLRAYRDQMAEVNHIHIEGADEDGSVLDLTVMFAVYREPVSPEEAQKLLDRR